MEERQQFVAVIVIDWNAQEVTIRDEWRFRAHCAHIQDIVDSIFLQKTKVPKLNTNISAMSIHLIHVILKLIVAKLLDFAIQSSTSGGFILVTYSENCCIRAVV